MIRLDKLRLFPFKTSELFFPGNLATEKQINLVFYPENSNFNLGYRNLRIQRRFFRRASICNATVPVVQYKKELISQFLLFRLIPIRNYTPNCGNVVFDTTFYLTKLDGRYGKGNYRRSVVLDKIRDYLIKPKLEFPNRQNVLLYYVDITQDLPANIFYRRGWVVADAFKRGDFMGFDYILLAMWNGSKIYYYCLKNLESSLTWTRVYTVIQAIKPKININDIESANEDISNDIVVTSEIDETDIKNSNIETIDTINPNEINPIQDKENNTSIELKNNEVKNKDDKIDVNKVENIKSVGSVSDTTKVAVKQYLQNKPKLTSMVKNQPITPYTSQKIVLASILQKNFKNFKYVKKIVKQIDPRNYKQVISNLQRNIVPNLLTHDAYKNESRSLVYKDANINEINDNKNPSAILNKRKTDFQKSFQQDLIESFRLLSKNQKYPLRLASIKPVPVPIDPGNLRPSKMIQYNITLLDEKNRKHDIVIEIPEIQKDGTFLINGSQKYMMYQIIIDPIFFLKKNQGKLQTSYSTITMFLKETKYKSYFECYISGYTIPLALLMSYYIGFDNMAKLFGFSYQVVNAANVPRNSVHITCQDETAIVFNIPQNNSNKHIIGLINSISEITELKSAQQLFDKHQLTELLVSQTGNRNSIFKVDQVIANIMEPIAVEVLKSKMLPTTLDKCLWYIAYHIGLGRVDLRNDISKQRLRCSEVMSYQIQKRILASYSQYEIDREHGNDNAKYYCDTREIVKNIINSSTSKLMRDLDNINPYDELSALTSVSPVGDGGVPNADGITNEARNIDTSYYGNIDSMDTSENANIGILNHLTIDALIGNNRGSFGKLDKTEDAGAGVLSVCSAAVPYVNHNDGCRVMFSGSQGRQAIPIIGNQKPLVQTGYETIMTSMLTGSYIKKSYGNGIITKINDNVITIKHDDNTTQVIELDHPVLKTSIGQIKGSLNTFHPTVSVGDRVKDGQIVAEGKHIKDGVISVGSNLLVAMMGWKGYSFEDGYIISESVANKTFTSMSYEEKEVLITKDDNIKFIAESGTFTKSGDTLLIRSSKNIEEILGMDSDEIVEGQQVIKSPGGKILSIEIYPNISINKFPILIPEFLKFKKRWEEVKGEFPKKFFNASSDDGGVPFNGIRILFRIERYDQCILGDKITNNHGGKGTLTLIEKDENMPITPWGERVDLMFNPLAVINRMNPGTIYELYTGLIAKTMARRVVSLGFKKNQKAIDLVSTIYRLMDNTKDKVLSTNLIKSFKNLNDKQYTQFINQIIDDGYVMPIYVPPFKEPNSEMINEAMRYLSLKKNYYLTLPEYGTKTLEPVAVGYLYYKKLEQQAGYKQSVRSTGRYNTTTGQATTGKAQGGGQRVGEMDSYALISHGAINTLKELFGPLSDDKRSKDEIISEIISTGSAEYKQPQESQSVNRLKIYMYGMMISNDIGE